MRYHRNAVTNVKQREKIRDSQRSARGLAKELEVSHTTVRKWKERLDTNDRSSAPQTIHYAVDKADWQIIKKVRQRTLLSLDEIVDALTPYISQLNRSNCYRILCHYNLNKLTRHEEEKRKKFARYEPGFLHMDLFYLPKLNGQKRHYCYLAIDRATRMLYLAIYPKKGHLEAADFLVQCMNYFPFRIHRILTDNGADFTLRRVFNRWGKVSSDSLFDNLCRVAGIKRKYTKVKHPWTNGMAERAVRTIKEHTLHIKTYQDNESMARDLKAFQEQYNFVLPRPVLNRKTPLQSTMEWFVKVPNIFISDPYRMPPNPETTL